MVLLICTGVNVWGLTAAAVYEVTDACCRTKTMSLYGQSVRVNCVSNNMCYAGQLPVLARHIKQHSKNFIPYLAWSPSGWRNPSIMDCRGSTELQNEPRGGVLNFFEWLYHRWTADRPVRALQFSGRDMTPSDKTIESYCDFIRRLDVEIGADGRSKSSDRCSCATSYWAHCQIERLDRRRYVIGWMKWTFFRGSRAIQTR